jgi:hypothetical protein
MMADVWSLLSIGYTASPISVTSSSLSDSHAALHGAEMLLSDWSLTVAVSCRSLAG